MTWAQIASSVWSSKTHHIFRKATNVSGTVAIRYVAVRTCDDQRIAAAPDLQSAKDACEEDIERLNDEAYGKMERKAVEY